MVTINPKYLIGISISQRKNGDGYYTVFTIPTQHFHISDLSELSDEVFENAIVLCKQQRASDLLRFKDAFPGIRERLDNVAMEYLLKNRKGL